MVAQLHRHVFHQRNDFQHKLSRELVNNHGFIAVEDLNGTGLAGGMLAKSVQDAAWSSFIAKLSYKAESADRLLVKVNARGTSQPCPCGAPVPKNLWDRLHQCAACGLKTTRDHRSAFDFKAWTAPENRNACDSGRGSRSHQHRQRMMGLFIDAWDDLPVEAAIVWLAVAYGTIIVFEMVKLWQASGLPAKDAFVGLRE